MPAAKTSAPTFFPGAEAFRRWLEKNHATAKEFWVGYYKKASGRGGMSYPQALDEALCFGWIDGIVRTLDADRYMQRFTPRKPGGNWSNLNVRHIERLEAAGRMHASGLDAFAARDPAKTGIYSFEQKTHTFPPEMLTVFKGNRKAWLFWGAQPPGYRRLLTHWVTSAKQSETRDRRLKKLIQTSAAGKRIR